MKDDNDDKLAEFAEDDIDRERVRVRVFAAWRRVLWCKRKLMRESRAVDTMRRYHSYTLQPASILVRDYNAITCTRTPLRDGEFWLMMKMLLL